MMLYMADPEHRRVRFEAPFREHHSAVRAYARRRVPSEAVDDIVSETFLVVWRRLDQVPEPALPWLLAAARNVVGTEWRGAASVARQKFGGTESGHWRVLREDAGSDA